MFFGFLIASPLLVFASWFPYELDPRTAVPTLGSTFQAGGSTHGAWCGHGGQDHSGLRIESDSHAYNDETPQVGAPLASFSYPSRTSSRPALPWQD